MENAKYIYNCLENKTPVCFIKLNDGEIAGLNSNTTGISRGDEKSSPLMAEKLRNALNYRQPNYYIGLPCHLCNNEHYTNAISNITINDENKMTNVLDANILINSNTNKTIDVIQKTMNDRNIVIVTNNTNIKNINKLSKININPYKIISVSEQYAFTNDYERIKDEWEKLNDNDVVICLCGPLGRILCHEWFSHNNNLTCLELGSLFDPILKNRTYLYHTGNHQVCENCYPSQDCDDCILLTMCDGTLNKECYYFYNEESYCNFYRNSWAKIRKNSLIRLEKEPDNLFLKYMINLSYTKQLDETICSTELALKEGHSLQAKEETLDLKKTITIDNVLNHFNKFSLIDKPLRNNDKMFYIVYHIATINDNWKILTERSYKKIIGSGILDDLNCKKMFISYLGDESNIDPLLKIWNHPKIELKNFGSNKERYEFPAMKFIRNLCKDEDCNMLYFHCKGLLHENDKIKDWIDMLEYFNIEKYKHCLDKLIDYDMVGCNYYPSIHEISYVENPFPFYFNFPHFSGNYWWTKSSYVNTFKDELSETNRFDAEFWICKNSKKNFWSFYNPGINFGGRQTGIQHKPFNRQMYEGMEFLNFNYVPSINNKMDCLFKKYLLDKHLDYGHDYVPVYSEVLNGKNVSNLLEIGIGCIEENQMSHLISNGVNYKTGNSLRMWKELFEGANIYGIDIFEQAMINGEERINTFVCDQSNEIQLLDLMKKINKPLDIIVDDGSHLLDHQILTFFILENYLSEHGIYIIEDIFSNNIEQWETFSFINEDYKKYLENKYEIKRFDRRRPNDSHSAYIITFNKKSDDVFKGTYKILEPDYRNNNKSQLYNLASNFYNQHDLKNLDRVCDLYIDY